MRCDKELKMFEDMQEEMEEKEMKLRGEWRSYVDSYESQTAKKMHLLSCTHVVFKLIEKACSD